MLALTIQLNRDSLEKQQAKTNQRQFKKGNIKFSFPNSFNSLFHFQTVLIHCLCSLLRIRKEHKHSHMN